MARTKQKPVVIKRPFFDDLSPQARQAIGAVIFGVLAVFFIFSLVGYAGVMGEYVEIALHYLFGAGAWLAPLLCLGYIYVLLSPTQSNGLVSRSKIIGTALIFLALLAGLELYEVDLGGLLGLGITWPLVALLGGAVAGVLVLGIFLIGIFLLLNTGLHFPALKKFFVKTTPSDDADIEKLDLPDLEPAPLKAEDEPEESEAEKASSLAMITKKVTELGKLKANDIVIKNFSGTYIPPSLTLLNKEKGKPQIGDVKANANTIKRTLREFGISVEMDAVESGPTISRYALKPAQGVRIAKIAGLQQELQLALKASSIRIEAPIPGKSLVGIEVPNQVRATVALSTLLSTPEYTDSPHPLMAALGKDVTGEVHFTNIARMPHGLIAGTTGSGKSVTIQSIIISLLYRNSPEQLRFILVDPKRVELTLYNNIPHLLTPVITDAKKAILALSWAIKEMERRYEVLQAEGKQNIASYHKDIYKPAKEEWEAKGSDEEDGKHLPEAMPYIVVVIDELNDIMQAFPRELEACIVRIAQMARAVGIHLILATQRPSVNVITGTIKANIPTRIALAVASQIDSRTIIDAVGAEKLIGQGDMLYLSSDSPKPIRLQSAYVSEDEIKRVVEYLKKQNADEVTTIDLENHGKSNDSVFNAQIGDSDSEDDLYDEAKQIVLEAGKASTSYIQRKLRIGYSRAARLVDMLEENGVVGPASGSKAREVIDGGSSGHGQHNDPVPDNEPYTGSTRF